MRLRIPKYESKHNPVYLRRRNGEICRQYQKGATAAELANQYNLSKWTIKKVLSSNGIVKREEQKLTLVDEVKTMLSMGFKNISEIARRTGKSRQRIHQVIREHNLEVKR